MATTTHPTLTQAAGALGAATPARRRWRPFVRHYVEMVVAMMVGMVVLGPLARLGFSALDGSDLLQRPDVMAIVMATNMAIGMSLWMRYRRHGWPSILEMDAAMYLPFAALLLPHWAGLVSGGMVMTGGHVLMLPAMAAAMLRRRHEYLGHH